MLQAVRRGAGTYLVRARILKQHHPFLLHKQPCLLSEEQVRALDDVFEVGFPLRVDELVYVRDVDGFGAACESRRCS